MPDPVDQAHQVALIVETSKASETAAGTSGQRRINAIWEITQALIAVSVTMTTLYVAGRLAVNGAADMSAFLLLSNAFFLVIGFYFGRTNHTKVGGVGINEER